MVIRQLANNVVDYVTGYVDELEKACNAHTYIFIRTMTGRMGFASHQQLKSTECFN